MISNIIIVMIIQSLLLLFIGTFVNVKNNSSKFALKFLPMILGVTGLTVSIFELLQQ